MKKAVLVDFSYMVRVIVDEDATEEDIRDLAIDKIHRYGLHAWLIDACDSQEEDYECPYGTFESDIEESK